MTEDERNEQIAIRKKMLAEIRRLQDVCKSTQAACEEWKERYEAEFRDHQATIEHTNKMLAEDYP